MHPAAWHPDPTGRHQFRYWDGSTWTEHVANNGMTATDPLDAGAPEHATEGHGGTSQPTLETLQQEIDELKRRIVELNQAGPAQAGAPFGSAKDPASPDLFLASTSRNTLATAAAVVGAISLLLSFIPVIGVLGVIAGIGAVIFGVVGRQRAKQSQVGSGAALAGIITGALAAAIGILFTIVIVSTINSTGFMNDFREFAECVEETDDVDGCADQFENSELFRLFR